jgi:hypothetical protein
VGKIHGGRTSQGGTHQDHRAFFEDVHPERVQIFAFGLCGEILHPSKLTEPPPHHIYGISVQIGREEGMEASVLQTGRVEAVEKEDGRVGGGGGGGGGRKGGNPCGADVARGRDGGRNGKIP